MHSLFKNDEDQLRV